MSSKRRIKWTDIGSGLLVALLFVLVWSQTNSARPHMETSDIFTHLSVARHLVQGDGFVTDITYPLSFAFDFAQELPQPLIHRGPGFPLLLTAVVATSPDDPYLIVNHVRWLQLVFLGLLAGIGTIAFLRRGNPLATGTWLVFLGLSPLLGFAVDWAFVELPAALLLLFIWLRHREIPEAGPGWIDGILVGLLVLLRWDLVWLPLLWWLWGRLELQVIARREPAATVPSIWNRKLLLALLMVVLVNLPWAVRNTQLTGQPFFTLQGQAELAKETRSWPGYSVYQQLEPQPMSKVMAGDPVPVLRKFVRGLKFYFQELGRLFPWAGLVFTALSLMVYLRGSIDKNPCPLRPNAEHPMSIVPSDSPLGPLAVSGLTLILLIVQYSFFDHNLRHLIVLFPLVAWELSGLFAIFISEQCKRWNLKAGTLMASSILVALLLIKFTLQPLPGWQIAEQQAERQQSSLAEKTRQLNEFQGSVPFVGSSAAPWYANRPAVWDPGNEKTRNLIREKLSHQ